MHDDLAPILQRLEDRLTERIGCIDEKLDKVRTEDLPAIRVDVGQLKVKAGVWGGVAGILASLGVLVVSLISR